MRMHPYFTGICAILLIACHSSRNDIELAAFEVFCEQVSNGAKPLALSHPMEAKDLDALWGSFQGIAKTYGVALFREDQFPETMLFPSERTEERSVVIIYKKPSLKQYQQWKADLGKAPGENTEARLHLARRLGRLLGYSPEGINGLLRQHSGFRDLSSFGVREQLTHFYYSNPRQALDFYENILGLEQVDSTRFRIGADSYLQVHPLNESHPEGQANSTAIALLTDQLPSWYAHIKRKNIDIKYTYKPRVAGPHDGFVAIDPGGYLLEFEQFKQHPENERFMAVLADAPRIQTQIDSLNFYGSITWTYHRDLLQMQRFYEEVFGFALVADQGWTKIYQTTSSGFIGLVDERRGMQEYADLKAVEIQWHLAREEAFEVYAAANWEGYEYSKGLLKGPEKYIYRFQGVSLEPLPDNPLPDK